MMESGSSPGSSDIDASFNVSESLVPARDLKTAEVNVVDFDGLLKTPLLLQEDLKEGCGGQLWPAGMVLAKYLLRRHCSDLDDKIMSVTSSRTGAQINLFSFSPYLIFSPAVERLDD
jgi:hypothetical protein